MDIKNKPSNDMKPSRFLTAICLLATALAVGGCTQDEGMDGNGIPLPEGKYPLMLTATQNEVVASPQTRVADYEEGGNQKSKWTAGDHIKVAVSEGGNDMETTCTLDGNGNITNYNPKLYWKTTQSSKINAWYSNITGQSTTTSSTVSLANQSSGLAYVLKADELTGKNYQSGNISLSFKHQLAKVRVKVVKGTYTGVLNVTAVSVKGYTCTVSNGTVTASGTLSDIKTKKNTYGTDVYWEANLVPGTSALSKTITIAADNKTTTCTLVADASLASGNVYTYTVTVNAAGPTVYPAGNVIPEITDDGEYIIEGNGTETTNGITISGSPTVTLKNVNITSDLGIKIQSGTPTIIIDGNNTFTSAASCISLQNNTANVIINGENSGTLTINSQNGFDAAIGSKYCVSAGNITIKNIKLIITNTNMSAAAFIGTGKCFYNDISCGNIEIFNTELNISGGHIDGAFIGTGLATGSRNNRCGNITITLKENDTKEIFLNRLTCMGLNYSQDKVGKGGTANGGSQTCGTITWKKSDGTLIN